MDKKRYKSTRYQNIYKNIKNGNYIIRISNPDTTISKDKNNNKIYDINLAKDIRDNKSNRIVKTQQIKSKDVFSKVWSEYIKDCKKKLEYNTYHKKEKLYNSHYEKFFNDLKVSKILKQDVKLFLNNARTTNGQKNILLKELRAFFNWCIKKEILLMNPTKNIEYFKEEKKEMRYWTPEHLKKILSVLDDDIKNNVNKSNAYFIKMFIILGFNLGARIGEVRALSFCDVLEDYNKVFIRHSIEYNPNIKTFLKATKNPHSKRSVDVSPKLIHEIKKYKSYLVNELKLDIKDDTIILTYPKTKKPISDTKLRALFNEYIEKAGVPKIRMYDLRHTYVTTMMSEGFEIYAISKRIGHSDIQTTVNTYGHLSEKIRKELAVSTDKYY